MSNILTSLDNMVRDRIRYMSPNIGIGISPNITNVFLNMSTASSPLRVPSVILSNFISKLKEGIEEVEYLIQCDTVSQPRKIVYDTFVRIASTCFGQRTLLKVIFGKDVYYISSGIILDSKLQPVLIVSTDYSQIQARATDSILIKCSTINIDQDFLNKKTALGRRLRLDLVDYLRKPSLDSSSKIPVIIPVLKHFIKFTDSPTPKVSIKDTLCNFISENNIPTSPDVLGRRFI